MIDPEILRQLGWSDQLIQAAVELTETAPRPFANPVGEAVVDPLASVHASDRIIPDSEPVGLAALLIRA